MASARLLCRPVPQAGVEALRHEVQPQPPQQLRERDVGKDPPLRGAGKTTPVPSPRPRASFRMASALRERGTWWFLLVFILVLGIVHVSSRRSTSSHVMPRTSPERQADSANISNASLTVVLDVDSRTVSKAAGGCR